MMTRRESEGTERELRKDFSVIDRDNSGTVSVNELRKVLASFGENLTKEEAAEMIRHVTDEDQIEYEEFVDMLREKDKRTGLLFGMAMLCKDCCGCVEDIASDFKQGLVDSVAWSTSWCRGADDLGGALRKLSSAQATKQVASVARRISQPSAEVQLQDDMDDDDDVISDKELIQAFKVFDRNRDGTITAKECRHVMALLGVQLTDEEVSTMVQGVSENGEMDIHDFKQLLNGDPD